MCLGVLYTGDFPVVLTNMCRDWLSSFKALLCMWHISKGVLRRCHQFFSSKNGQGTDEVDEMAWD